MTPTQKKKWITLIVSSVTLALVIAIAACTGGDAKAKPKLIVKDAPKPGIVAKVAGQEITEDELLAEDKIEYFNLLKQIHELKMEALNRVLVDRLIGAEAKSSKMKTDDYIEKKLLKGKLKVSDSEYNKFVKERKIPKKQLNDQIKKRIIAYLKTKKRQDVIDNYVAKLTRKSPVEVYFKKPRMDIKVALGASPVTGGDKAKVTIVEFSDFQCPFCSRAAKTVNEIKKKYGSKVKIAFKHFPLPMHPEAKPASEASMCIHEQNKSKFWKFHDLLFDNQRALGKADLEKYAKKVGADVAKFKTCMESKKFKKMVEEDLSYGEKLGVRSTPTFFVNGQLLSGAQPFERFKEVIDEELEMAKK